MELTREWEVRVSDQRSLMSNAFLCYFSISWEFLVNFSLSPCHWEGKEGYHRGPVRRQEFRTVSHQPWPWEVVIFVHLHAYERQVQGDRIICTVLHSWKAEDPGSGPTSAWSQSVGCPTLEGEPTPCLLRWLEPLSGHGGHCSNLCFFLSYGS